MRARARAFVEAFARPHGPLRGDLREQGVPLHRGLPAVRRRGPVAATCASGGELHLALARRIRPSAHLHARQQQVAGRARLRDRERRRPHRGRLVRRDRAPRAAARPARDAARHARHQAETHSYIQTGQVDSKFGFPIEDVPRAIERCATPASSCAACTRTSARRSSSSSAFEKLGEVLAAMGDFPLLNLGGGLGIAYTRGGPPAADRGLRGGARSARPRRA